MHSCSAQGASLIECVTMFRTTPALVALPCLMLALVYCKASSTTQEQGVDPTAAADAASGSSGQGGSGGASLGSGGSSGTGNGDCPGTEQSYIWIANTAEGTLSKVCTTTGDEVARYNTSAELGGGDPSRTSVNLHGDAVVTNRDPTSGPSTVTKFAGDHSDCVDKNDNNKIDTSTGPDDVKPWGEDECMLWNVPLGSGSAIGARATAWDGKEDPDTGIGGHVFIGAMSNKTVYKLNGETGEIMDQAATALGHYGGAIDNKGNLWTVDMFCTVGNCSIERISLDNLSDHETHIVKCGYGISVDAKGRVWTAGMAGLDGGCVSRFDPETSENVWTITGGFGDFNRGVAVGFASSEGSVWAANTVGDLVQVNMETMELVKRQKVGGDNMVGIAIDFEGYVWTVSQTANTAYKIDPVSWQVTPVAIGSGPYTYSDMTGIQLKSVIEPPK